MDIKILRATEEWQRAGAYSMPLRSLRSEVRGVILEQQVPELVEGCGDRIHKHYKTPGLKAGCFFYILFIITHNSQGIFDD
jgi:hypothetical protein